MIWPFSLPPSLPKRSRFEGFYPIDRIYPKYKHVIVTNCFPNDDSELDLWCQLNFCYYFYDRVLFDQWSCKWHSNGIGGFDAMVICTNDDSSATMAILRWQ